MSHNHTNDHADSNDLRLAFALNLGFTILEIIGGALINSIAIMSDALHDLGDSLSLGLAWYLQHLSKKESDNRYSYGYRRFSLLGAFINSVVLLAGSLYILTEAIPRLLDPESFDAPGMIAFASLGIVVNGLAVLRLRNTQSSNAQVVGLHLLEDVLGWVAVLIVGIVSLFVDVPILDPILSLMITTFVLFNVLSRLRQSVRLFLQAIPESIDLSGIEQTLRQIDGVRSTHHTHIWSLDGEHNVFTTHLVVADDTKPAAIMRIRTQANEAITDLHMEHITVAIEYESENCAMQ